MNYWLHPEAQEDLREAAEFYREQAGTTLSQSFIAEFEHSVSLLLQYPHLGGMWRHRKRRLVTRRFPFSVIYTVVGDQIRILAVDTTVVLLVTGVAESNLTRQVPNPAFECAVKGAISQCELNPPGNSRSSR